MLSNSLFTPLGTLEPLLAFITFFLLVRSQNLKAYWPLFVVTLWQVLPSTILVLLRTYRILSAQHAYATYFYCYWLSFACAAVCSGLLTYTIFRESLRPLKGLQSLGRVMFRWIVAISICVAVSDAIANSNDYYDKVIMAASELQRLSGVVVLALVVFVMVTVRPLGLTYRSRIFGVSAGVCIATIANMLSNTSLFSSPRLRTPSLLSGAGCVAQMVWIWYFAVPEPTRKFLLLPTTSPFHQWNLVSERMGYDPGYVAIGGVPPASFSEAERVIFERIAAQDNGRAERLNEITFEAAALEGSSTETIRATRHFHEIWNFRYQSEAQEVGLASSQVSDQ